MQSRAALIGALTLSAMVAGGVGLAQAGPNMSAARSAAAQPEPEPTVTATLPDPCPLPRAGEIMAGWFGGNKVRVYTFDSGGGYADRNFDVVAVCPIRTPPPD